MNMVVHYHKNYFTWYSAIQINSYARVPPNKFKCYSTATKDSWVRVLPKQIHVSQYCQKDCKISPFPETCLAHIASLSWGRQWSRESRQLLACPLPTLKSAAAHSFSPKTLKTSLGWKPLSWQASPQAWPLMLRGRYPSSAYLKVKTKSWDLSPYLQSSTAFKILGISNTQDEHCTNIFLSKSSFWQFTGVGTGLAWMLRCGFSTDRMVQDLRIIPLKKILKLVKAIVCHIISRIINFKKHP